MEIELTRANFSNGDIILYEGDAGDVAYLVVSGRVVAYREENGAEHIYSVMGPKSIFGELALINKDLRSLNVRATEDTECIVVTKDVLNKVLERADPILRALMLGYMARLRETSSHKD